MNKKELKQQQAIFHAFIKSQQRPEIEKDITFVDGEEERTISVKVKQKLTFEEQINFVHRVVGFCVDEETGMIYPSSFEFGYSLALLEYFTNIKEQIKDTDIMDFLSCFDIEKFIHDACDGCAECLRLHRMCKTELEWEQEKYLNSKGVNGIFEKISSFIERLDVGVDAIGDYMNAEKLEELLKAVNSMSQAPELVAEKVIDIERARVRAQKEAKEAITIIDFEHASVPKKSGDE